MPQPWALVGADAATVVAANLSSLTDWLVLTGYCLLATLSLVAMETYEVCAPAAAEARLNGLRTWTEQHQDQLIVRISVLVGLWLTAGSIYELVA
ncbi:GAP family protein [Streptomyces sp. AB3(2024)]|uniref:GAP family protein n=1 Tax=Streptomyces sp. AB3(2024) TaxID=3317321 RepID=UPI0035A26312